MSFPLIAWVHSPIGYETYLTIREQYPGDVHLVLARNMIPLPDASAELPGGLYWNDSAQQISDAAADLVNLVNSVIKDTTRFVLLIPQSAVPYIRLLVQSDLCAGFIYYDEGLMCHDVAIMQRRSRPTHHRYHINWVEPLLKLAETLGVEVDQFSKTQLDGVPLLDFQNKKLLGCVSFFEDAFPTLGAETLALTGYSKTITDSLRDVTIILLPPKNSRPSVDPIRFTNSLITFFSLKRSDCRAVVKLHPSDRWDSWTELNSFEFDTYEKLVEEIPDIVNREVAFLPFFSFVTPPNSTGLFLKKMSKANVMEFSR